MTDIIIPGQDETPQEDGITQFWDDYEANGIDYALEQVRDRSEDNDLLELEQAVPFLVQEARARKIDILNFLQELDAHLAVEVDRATGTDNGVSGVSADSDNEADQAQDGDESGSAQDADGEARSE